MIKSNIFQEERKKCGPMAHNFNTASKMNIAVNTWNGQSVKMIKRFDQLVD